MAGEQAETERRSQKDLNKALHAAIHKGDVKIARDLISAGADATVKGCWSTPLLHCSVRTGKLETVKYVIEDLKSPVNAIDNNGWTALMLASCLGHKEILEFLLSCGANAMTKNFSGQMALHVAVEACVPTPPKKEVVIKSYSLFGSSSDDEEESDSDYDAENEWKTTDTDLKKGTEPQCTIEVLKVLLAAGADPLETDNSNCNVLHYAAIRGDVEILKFLLGLQKIPVNRHSVLMLAITHHGWLACKPLFDVLLKAGANIDHLYDAWTLASKLASDTDRNLEGLKATLAVRQEHWSDFEQKFVTAFLHNAIEKNKKEIVELMIRAGVDVNAKISYESPICKAVKVGNVEVVKLLINSGADVNAKCLEETPLYTAIIGRKIEIIKTLIAAGADVNQNDCGGECPLSLALECNDVSAQVFEILIASGADFKRVYIYGEKILSYALQYNNLEVVKLLIRNGADVNADDGDHTALYRAVRKNNLEMVKLLVQAGASVNKVGFSGEPPLCAVDGTQDSLELVKFLINSGADVNAVDGECKALCNAAQQTNIELVKFLIKAGACVNKGDSDGTPLFHAVTRFEECSQVLQLLISAGADINLRDTNSKTLLHQAVQVDNFKAVQYLLKMGLSPMEKDSAGNTLLHLAATYCRAHSEILLWLLKEHVMPLDIQNELGQTALAAAVLREPSADKMWVVETLLAAGSNIAARDKEGSTVLHLAALSIDDEIQMLKCLILAGADVQAKDKRGWTILHQLSESYYDDGIEYILEESNVYVDERDSDGLTALMIAARNHSYYTKSKVRKLLERGARLSIRDNCGLTALHHAIDASMLSEIRVLLEFGADIASLSQNYRDRLLRLAASHRSLEMVKQLVAYGASPATRSLLTGKTAAHYGVRQYYSDTVEYLLESGTPMDDRGVRGQTVLGSAVTSLEEYVVEYLLKKDNFSVNERNENGQTPIMLMKDGYRDYSFSIIADIVKLLVASGAKLDVLDDNGYSPLHEDYYFYVGQALKER